MGGHRICLIGPECTGKTTLAQRLAEHFHASWVPEFAREYAEERNNRLTYQDVEPIARGELAQLSSPESRIPNLVLLDTDLISTVVYARHYYGRCPDWIVNEARDRRAGLYLLMDTDVEWKADAARDTGGDGREDLFDAFRRALDEFETRWVIISGDWEERFRSAISVIEEQL
ncbi:MAG TPA: ATP-binding protein [Thermoanaerobaculia bacterium]|nr:ATP-binding protein [Thermoanaerobaculia bacterium]